MAEDEKVKKPLEKYLEGINEGLLKLKLTDDHEVAHLVRDKASDYFDNGDVAVTSVKDVLVNIWKRDDTELLKKLCDKSKSNGRCTGYRLK